MRSDKERSLDSMCSDPVRLLDDAMASWNAALLALSTASWNVLLAFRMHDLECFPRHRSQTVPFVAKKTEKLRRRRRVPKIC